MATMTTQQRAALDVLRAEDRGYDADELARRLDTSPEGAARTAASLVRRGLVGRFRGGVGRQRVHWYAYPECMTCDGRVTTAGWLLCDACHAKLP